jgi:dipeptidyl aminopeptidase/acylaminoacyl peptidase
MTRPIRTAPRAPAAALAALLACAAAAPLTSQARVPGPSFEDVIGLRGAGSPAISPDGRAVAFTVRSAEWQENRFDTEIWLARQGEEPFQLTRTEKGSSTGPRWSPDGRWIAFTADRGDRSQVYLVRAAGGEARKLTSWKEGVGAFRWSPDGRRIAFTAQEAEDEAARKRRERYGDFAVEDAEFRQSHLWLVDVAPDALPGGDACPARPDTARAGSAPAGDARPDSATADTARADTARAASRGGTARGGPGCSAIPEPRRLTGGREFTVSGFAWAPDGTRIAYERRSDPGINATNSADVWIVPVAGGEGRALVSGPGYEGSPVWSPDSRWVLFSTSAGDTASNFYTNGQLARVPAAGGTPQRLAADLDEQLGSVAWTPAGIYLLAWNGTRRSLYAVDGRTGRTRRISRAPEVVTAVDFSADGRTLALAGQTPSTLPEIYRTPLSSYRPVAVTDMSRQIRSWGLGTAETVSWTSTDGARVEGVLHRPPGFDPSRKYPLMVVIHGGPTSIDYPQPVTGYVYPVLQWLAKGALVLRPNYRGSAGYGERFRALNVRNLGVGDAWDVLSGVDHLVKQGIVDTTRMASMGWSQGGYISAFLTTTSTRFKAVSVGAGISNWMTYYVNTDIHPFTRQYLKATPWDDPEIYARTSPITYVKQARTPTLIQHGERDQRVPIANAYELFQGLQDQGVDTRLVVYRGFGHGIDRPKEQLAATWHNWQWFGKHLWGEDVELPL